MRTPFLRPLGLLCAVLGALLFAPATVRAHGLSFTRVEASFNQPGVLEVTIGYDFGLILSGRGQHYALSISDRAAQQAAIDQALPTILAGLQLFIGDHQLDLTLQDFTVPRLDAAAFDDPAQEKSTELHLTAPLPEDRGPLVLVVPYGSRVDYPVMFTAGIPAADVRLSSWVEEDWGASEPFDWANLAPRPPWYREFATYLRLGFKHIVPEGTDHILFVLALFFLGLTWRKLVAQTTVFTVAHATTLFLSRYGIFSLPSRYIEPLIAFSIACIALENVFRPKLGPGRLALVFVFGLVHGLGFASSLNEVSFPQEQFVLALLGFNLGVDGGQLFIIALALLTVGWFRHQPWFRARVAIPCSLLIAGIGLWWTIQRIVLYSAQY